MNQIKGTQFAWLNLSLMGSQKPWLARHMAQFLRWNLLLLRAGRGQLADQKFSELGDESNWHGLQAAGYGKKNGFQGTSMAYSNWSFYYIR